MQDRVSLYPGRVKLEPVAGQANTYDLTRADQPTQEGTPLNKATLLKDITATRFDLESDAVPDDAFSLLSRFHKGLGNEYLWEKSKTEEEYKYTISKTSSNFQTGAKPDGLITYIPYGDGFTVNSDNQFVLTNRKELAFSYSNGNSSELNLLAGKYYFVGSSTSGVLSKSQIVKCPVGSTVTTQNGDFVMRNCDVYVDPFILYNKTIYGYVNSPDHNAYPPAVSDGYTYTALGQLGNKAQIITGSYVGTGTYGQANPNSLTFGFEPKIVMVAREKPSSGQRALFMRVSDYATTWYGASFSGGNVTGCNNAVTWSGNTMSWYTTANDDYQLNASGKKYNYIAIC